jgi:lipopolysaccharide heptosyltransferase II
VRPHHRIERLVILAPNWLGDAVMALPAIAAARGALRDASIAVAARPSVAPLFRMVAGVDETIVLETGRELDGGRFDAALLLPNSFHAAWLAARARIPERWGYRADWRGPLLTRGFAPPARVHQVEYYRRLAQSLGFSDGPIEPTLDAPGSARDAASSLLRRHGWDGGRRLVAMAPGAAYGGAKRWPASSFAELATMLAADGLACVLVGSAADEPVADEVIAATRRGPAGGSGGRNDAIINLVGRTDLVTLAGVLATCRALVTNDSGAMHLAAALGVPVTAVFGPTDERATGPVGEAHAVVTGPAWCRPCLLRECPLDHRCMRGIGVAPVAAAARGQATAPPVPAS